MYVMLICRVNFGRAMRKQKLYQKDLGSEAAKFLFYTHRFVTINLDGHMVNTEYTNGF